jgi:hypothetical protein
MAPQIYGTPTTQAPKTIINNEAEVYQRTIEHRKHTPASKSLSQEFLEHENTLSAASIKSQHSCQLQNSPISYRMLNHTAPYPSKTEQNWNTKRTNLKAAEI